MTPNPHTFGAEDSLHWYDVLCVLRHLPESKASPELKKAITKFQEALHEEAYRISSKAKYLLPAELVAGYHMNRISKKLTRKEKKEA